ncbi:MAG: hybrid sensory histidine kinase BarA [Methanoregulaceae archaeon PtaB.Bin056]|nr:MAG: hybrid sensory histidine kinase BarA [Methanoregulaceae archaeon PtaB.Bin056]HII75853.1 response regulator [Methanolinea sp.]HNQ29817.1 response regulator [Methanolinea sp.]
MTRVLIADDNQRNLYLLEAIMKGNGFEVVSARNGAEALAAAKRDPPDIIVTDILMPVMDGFELCRRWKADPVLAPVPFIFYTATYTDPKDEQFARSLGAERFLIKPQKPDVLVAEIRQVIEESRSLSGRREAKPQADEKEILQEYSEVLFRKLEKKVMQLEEEIAERKALEEQREAIIRDLEQKNAELERFTYTVSHDLKSPLITIQGFAGLLREDAQKRDMDRLQEDISRITDAAGKMQDLLTDLFNLSRIGRIGSPYEDISLSTIAREAVHFLSAPLAEKRIAVEISPDLPVVHVDHTRIREVYTNLIENSIKFMQEQESPKVRIGMRESVDGPVFFVQDNGMGIDSKYLSKIFGLFEKMDGRSAGTGIGLAIVKRIIEVHGGRVWAESEGPGKGTTICFTLLQEKCGATGKE